MAGVVHVSDQHADEQVRDGLAAMNFRTDRYKRQMAFDSSNLSCAGGLPIDLPFATTMGTFCPSRVHALAPRAHARTDKGIAVNKHSSWQGC